MSRRKKYIVQLSVVERSTLTQFVSTGHHSARQITRARILLLADQGHTDSDIQSVLDVSRPTISKVRQRYSQGDFKTLIEGLKERPRPGRPIKVDSQVEAKLTMLACSEPPQGRAQWTLRLIADELVRLEVVDSIAHETVRRTLKKTG